MAVSLAAKFHTVFLRMGGTGYQPVLVGNLPTRIAKDTLLKRRRRTREIRPAPPAGLVARLHGQVARATQRL
jgi:hypothetical protein